MGEVFSRLSKLKGLMIGNPWQKQFNQLENRKLKKIAQHTEKRAEDLVFGYLAHGEKHGNYLQQPKTFTTSKLKIDAVKKASLKKIIDNVVDNMVGLGITEKDTLAAVDEALNEVDLDTPDYGKLESILSIIDETYKKPFRLPDMKEQLILLSEIVNETKGLKQSMATNLLPSSSASTNIPFSSTPLITNTPTFSRRDSSLITFPPSDSSASPPAMLSNLERLNNNIQTLEDDRQRIETANPSPKPKSDEAKLRGNLLRANTREQKKIIEQINIAEGKTTTTVRKISGNGLFGIPNMGISKTAEAMVYGRKTLPPPVLNFLAKHGTEPISQMFVQRTPLSNLLMNVINVGSVFTFKKGIENEAYDKLYHLRLLIRTKQGHNFILEKIDHINIMNDNTLDRKDLEQREVHGIPNFLNTDILLKRTEQEMGSEKFLKYSSRDSNCQDFVLNVLRSSGLLTADLQEFIKQPVKAIINDRTSKLANTLTDLGASVDVLLHGAGNPFKFDKREHFTQNKHGKKRVYRSPVEMHGTNHLKKKATKEPFEKGFTQNHGRPPRSLIDLI